MSTTNPKTTTRPKSGGGSTTEEKSLLLKELFLNASLLALMKETVVEAVELHCLERELARAEEEAMSAPAA